MRTLHHLTKDQQEIMPLFDGAFIENKPIPFPNREGTQGYSTLFYWAHLEAFETAEFPLHPHEGFEIMTFVFKGTLEHYDTASKKYTPLDAGGIQVTQTGSGVKHSEKIIKGTHLFQIWFDPDFSKSLRVNASYRDYQANEFKTQSENGVHILNYIGKSAPITSQTQKLEIQKRSYTQGKYTEELDTDFTYSYYLLEGEAQVQDVLLNQDGFIKLSKEKALHVEVNQRAVFFVIKSPTLVDYTRFIERY